VCFSYSQPKRKRFYTKKRIAREDYPGINTFHYLTAGRLLALALWRTLSLSALTLLRTLCLLRTLALLALSLRWTLVIVGTSRHGGS
jgi:hypothetical protein